MSTIHIGNLEADTIDQIVEKNEGIMFVECYKYSKGPLYIIEPTIKKLHEYGKIEFRHFRVNLLEQPSIEEKYQIIMIPCYLVFAEHELIDKIYGVTDFYEYLNKIME